MSTMTFSSRSGTSDRPKPKASPGIPTGEVHSTAMCRADSRGHPALRFGIRSKRLEANVDQTERLPKRSIHLKVSRGAPLGVPVHGDSTSADVRGGQLRPAS